MPVFYAAIFSMETSWAAASYVQLAISKTKNLPMPKMLKTGFYKREEGNYF
jgi:hypothetical protein